jgi:hypothetical protein
MLRLILRLFLLAYFVMPVVAGFLVVGTFVQVRNDIAPIFESASATISTATTALENELRNLGNNFRPLVNAVNAIRRALQTIVNFLRDTVYTLIDVVNGINVACSIGRTACIPKSINVTLPTLIDLTFINNISASITDISNEVNTVITTTTTTIGSYVSMLTLAVIMFVAWMLLTYLLFIIFLYTGLWKRT